MRHMQAELFAYPNLDVREAGVFDLAFADPAAPPPSDAPPLAGPPTRRVTGVRLDNGDLVRCSQVVLCTGTFLGGEIHLGQRTIRAGRWGDAASPPAGLSRSLADAGFALGRLQTGTPARIDKSTVRFDGLEVQHGDGEPEPFSFVHDRVDNAVSVVSFSAASARVDGVER
jgi:tRNA uridine 5-carboxymethylaminomethyl modification enzyme